MCIYDFLIEDADLVVYLFIQQLAECLICRDYAVLEIFNSVNDIVVRNTTFNDIILFLELTSFSTVNYIFQPFKVISFKYFHTKTIRDYRFKVKII